MCHGVLYKQLSAWMLHGLLLDQKREFFIEIVQHSDPDEVQCTCISQSTVVLCVYGWPCVRMAMWTKVMCT